MNYKFFKKVKEFVNDSFASADLYHFEKTVFWVKELEPESDEAMLIAAYSHDIQRAFANDEVHKKIAHSNKGFTDEKFLKWHQEEGARLMGEFLRSAGADAKLIKKVQHLIAKHEEGGDKDQDLLKDADSISFFDTNAEMFVKAKVKKMGKQKVRDKFEWMYERISSDKAKKIAQPMYEEAINLLESS